MAVLENNKPKTEKTSASVTSTLPKLYPTLKLDFKDISCNIPKLKSRSLRSKSSSDSKTLLGITEYSKRNLQKSKLIETKNSDQVGFTNNASLFLHSLKNYHGQIPVLHRHSTNFIRMSPPDTRSPSPLKKVSPKVKFVNKVKTITLDQDSKKKNKTENSRSLSPVKKASDNYRKPKSKTSTSGCYKSSEKVEGVKREDSSKHKSSRKNSNKKLKTKVLSSSNLEFSSESKSGKELHKFIGESNSIILKQVSQPSLCMNEKIIEPKEKISLDHIKNGVYSKDHRRLSFEKLHLCIEKSDSGEKKRGFLVTYTSEDLQKPEDISLALIQNLSSTSITTYSRDCQKKQFEGISESKTAIETFSGHELLLTPSMKLDVEREEIMSGIFQDSEASFEQQKEVHIPQDDANEYDSEVSTDGEVIAANKKQSNAKITNSQWNDHHKKNVNSLWKSREADMLNDVDYRQSVYHPAVSRRQKVDDDDMEFKENNKSVEDNFEFANKMMDTIARSCSPNLKNKYTSPGFTTDKMDVSNNDRLWTVNFERTDGKSIYNSVLQDVPFYGMKRIRTKKERFSGALLHFTLKIIRLFAIFNLWPGDNCHMLTSQSLRFAR